MSDLVVAVLCLSVVILGLQIRESAKLIADAIAGVVKAVAKPAIIFLEKASEPTPEDLEKIERALEQMMNDPRVPEAEKQRLVYGPNGFLARICQEWQEEDRR